MNIGIIGFGNMGEAVTKGLKEMFPDLVLGVLEKVSERAAEAEEKYGARNFTGDPQGFFAFADISVLAIKPQDTDQLMADLKPFSKNARFVSIVAGKKIESICRGLDTQSVARVMPNLAARYGKSFSGISFKSGENDPEFKTAALKIAEALGGFIEIPERLMPAIIGISGSGIAFVYQFLHAMALGGTKAGIAYDKSLEIVMKVVEGALEDVRRTGESPSRLITKVTSPAGTTIEGIAALEKEGFSHAAIEAVSAAAARAAEMET